MASLFKRTYTKFDPATGTRKQHKAAKWFGQFSDENGVTHRIPLARDKAAAQAMLNELVKRAELRKIGVFDQTEEHRATPLAEHVAAFEAFLRAKAGAPKHVANTLARLRTVITACGFKRLDDLNADKVSTWLATRREFAERPLSVSGSNHYAVSLKTFGAWLVRSERIGKNPFASLARLNEKVDRRLERRALTISESARLIDAAEKSAVVFRGLTGVDRSMLYRLALTTGLRASELASLTGASFDFTTAPPTVTVQAGSSKRRREDTLPLRADVAESLQAWLVAQRNRQDDDLPALKICNAAKAKHERCWPGTWHEKAAAMIRSDLDAAGIPFETEAGVCDFHSLRGSFITALSRAGVPLATVQKLARHSTPNLTANFYTHLNVLDLAGAAETIPSMTPPHESVRATGTTEMSAEKACTKACTKLAQTGDIPGSLLILSDTLNNSKECKNPREKHGFPEDFAGGAAGTRTQNQQIMSLLL